MLQCWPAASSEATFPGHCSCLQHACSVCTNETYLQTRDMTYVSVKFLQTFKPLSIGGWTRTDARVQVTDLSTNTLLPHIKLLLAGQARQACTTLSWLAICLFQSNHSWTGYLVVCHVGSYVVVRVPVICLVGVLRPGEHHQNTLAACDAICETLLSGDLCPHDDLVNTPLQFIQRTNKHPNEI